MRKGWFNDHYRHSLAAKGILTRRSFAKIPAGTFAPSTVFSYLRSGVSSTKARTPSRSEIGARVNLLKGTTKYSVEPRFYNLTDEEKRRQQAIKAEATLTSSDERAKYLKQYADSLKPVNGMEYRQWREFVENEINKLPSADAPAVTLGKNTYTAREYINYLIKENFEKFSDENTALLKYNPNPIYDGRKKKFVSPEEYSQSKMQQVDMQEQVPTRYIPPSDEPTTGFTEKEVKAMPQYIRHPYTDDELLFT